VLLFIDSDKAYDSMTREVLYNILNEFGIPMELVRIIVFKCNSLNSTVWVGKNLCNAFPIQIIPKQGDALSTLLFKSASEYTIRAVQKKTRKDWN
jgi:hypothetical protein